MSSPKYYGIYRGKVVNTGDPKGLGRLTLKVPQVLGDQETNWAYPITGVPENRKVPYGSFYDYTTQYAGSLTTTGVANTPIAMRLTTTDDTATQQVYIAGPDKTQIVFEKAGVYNFQWSGQFQNSGTAEHDVSVWLRQAQLGVTSTSAHDIPGSTGLISVTPTHAGVAGHVIVGWNYLINANANDYIELFWVSDTAQVVTLSTYASSSSPTYPSTASVVATVNLVGGFLPLTGDSVWVMFEGGDPNYPLWLGTF